MQTVHNFNLDYHVMFVIALYCIWTKGYINALCE